MDSSKIIRYAMIGLLALVLLIGGQLIASGLNRWLYKDPTEELIKNIQKSIDAKIDSLNTRNADLIKHQQELIKEIERMQDSLKNLSFAANKLEREIQDVYVDVNSLDRALQVIAGHELDSGQDQSGARTRR